MHNSKTTFHLSHTDLDGSGCIIIAKEYLENRTVQRISYNKISEMLKTISGDYEQLLITDLNFCEKDFKLLNEISHNFQKITYIDHHLYDFDYQKYITENMEIIVNTSKCATSLCYDYFLKKKKSVKRFSEFQKYVNIFDIWLEKNKEFPLAKDYNRLFWNMGAKSFEFSFFENPFLTDKLKERIKNIHSDIEEYFKKSEKEGLVIKDDKIVVSFLNEYISEIQDMYPDKLVYINLKSGYHFSIRISTSIEEDLSLKIKDELCNNIFTEDKLFSSGGHAHAFGITTKDLEVEEVLQYIPVMISKIKKILGD